MISKHYEMTLNDVVKFSIINGIGVFDTDSITTSKCSNPILAGDSKNPFIGANLTAAAEVEKKQGDSKNPKKQGNLTAPSRALDKIYILYKNNINIYNDQLKAAWEEFEQHRKELRCSIKKTQLKRMWKDVCDPILEEYGVDGLIASLNRSVQNGWRGLFPPPVNETEPVKSTGSYAEDDL